MGVEIGYQWIAQAAETLGKRFMGMDAINADAQNLGVPLLEARQVALQRGELVSSASRPVKDVESQDHVLMAAILREGDRITHGRRQRKVRRLLTHGRY
jgi:hypothetical protein